MDGSRPDILLVEDQPEIRETLAELLAESGFEVARAGDGAAALALLRGGVRPRLLVLDLAMPVMGGARLCRELARDRELARIPIILMSAGSAEPPPRPEGLVAYFAKPLDFPRFLETIRLLGGTEETLLPPPGTSLADTDPRRASCS